MRIFPFSASGNQKFSVAEGELGPIIFLVSVAFLS